MGEEERENELIADREMLRGSFDAVRATVLAQQQAGDLLQRDAGPAPRPAATNWPVATWRAISKSQEGPLTLSRPAA